LEIFKVFSPKQVNELEIWQKASEDTRKNLETLMKKEATNDFDVRLENLRQSREVDLKKLDWEQRKWESEREDSSKKWELVKKALTGPIGQAIQSMGSAGAERVRQGARRMPKVLEISCAQCKQPIYIDANADAVVCGKCGAFMEKQKPEPQQQPSESRALNES
jgi:hypothetical protein